MHTHNQSAQKIELQTENYTGNENIRCIDLCLLHSLKQKGMCVNYSPTNSMKTVDDNILFNLYWISTF